MLSKKDLIQNAKKVANNYYKNMMKYYQNYKNGKISKQDAYSYIFDDAADFSYFEYILCDLNHIFTIEEYNKTFDFYNNKVDEFLAELQK